VFLLSAVAYPLVLGALCVGAGLAVDRAAGGLLPGALTAVAGLAALIAVAQLSTYVPGVAPATPYLLLAVGVAGLALGWQRVREAVRGRQRYGWELALPVVVFVVACAPVLFAGRPTFSAYMVLTDSALHMTGADYLIRHGQHYAHLDLVNSYGQYINNYYNRNYPTGADALLGGTSSLLGVPAIWAFQPFNAFMLAVASGPAWLLARHIGLARGWAATAALSAAVPALVYAYDLIGSIKEITALPLILAMGALAVEARWLRSGPRGAIPFALVVAAGVSALGVAFGAWTVVAVAVLAGVAVGDGLLARREIARLAALCGVGAVVLVVCAWPTWHHASGSVAVAQAVASTPNRGNLVSPLRLTQVFGTWLTGNYEVSPAGVGLAITDVLIAVTALAALLGGAHLLRRRQLALSGWIALMVLTCFLLTRLGAVWADAKTLVLSSPVVILLAFAGVASLLRAGRRAGALALALVLAGGIVASDAAQYRHTDLAPTARYDELASIDARFAGRGPTLFTDFDEYALDVLRDLDVGGPDFSYPPIGLVGIDSGHGGQINLGHGRAAALRGYPLIVTRRDPAAVRPPSAYRLLWQGTYYQVWGRRPGAPAAIARFASRGVSPVRCARVHSLARVAASKGAVLVAASPAALVRIDLEAAHVPAAWRLQASWWVMSSPGTLDTTFRVPRAGAWNVWLQGEIMPTVEVRVDGRLAGLLGGQVGGDLVVPDTAAPLRIRLRAGLHRLTVSRSGFSLAPGNGGSAILTAIFLTPAGAGERQQLHTVPAPRWRELCGHRYLWVEAVRR